MKFSKLYLVLAFVLVLGVEGVQADPISVTMRISDNLGNSITVQDNGTLLNGGVTTSGSANIFGGGDVMPSSGYLGFVGGVGAWNMQFNAGSGSQAQGDGQMGLVFAVDSFTGTTSTLTIEFTQTSTTPAFPGWNLSIGGTVDDGIKSLSYAGFQDNTNTAYGQQSQIGSTLTFAPGAGPGSTAYSGSTGGPIPSVAPYSLTQVITITGSGLPFAHASGNADLTTAPEPGTLLLLGTGLAVVGIANRRRNKAGAPKSR